MGAEVTNELLRPREAAKMLGVSVATLRWWRFSKKGFTESVQPNVHHRYEKAAVLAYIDERKRNSAKKKT